MSAASPYYLPGASRLRTLEQRLQETLPALLRRWSPKPGAQCEARVSALDDVLEFAPERIRYLAHAGDCWLVLNGGERVWAALAESWLGCHVASGSSLVGVLEREFCMDLFQCVAQIGDIDTPIATVLNDVEWSEIPAYALRRGAGTLRIDWTLDAGELTLWASAPLLGSALANDDSSDVSALNPESRAQALNETRVRLSAHLPAVHLPLPEVATLAVGDFLNLRHDLSGRVELRGLDADVCLSAAVGRLDGFRAVSLLEAGRNDE